MSNETDLDWLARNVHEWVPNWLLRMKPCDNGNGTFRASWCYSGEGGFTKDQWLSRRAELQSKPSWKDAPEWAEWLSQDGSGYWYWYASNPNVPPGMRSWWPEPCTNNMRCGKGEVLGDWRDTLERRPADLSEPAVTERLTEAAQTVLAAAPALMDEKYSFEPEFMPVSVSNETVQLERPIAVAGTGNGSAAESAFLIGRVIDLLRTSVDQLSADELAELNELTGAELTKRDERVCGGQKYLDAHWFERGELPPFGLEVEWKPWSDAPWVKAVIMADAGDGEYVIRVDGVKKIVGSPANFRPIRTERDVLIEIIKKTDDTDDKIADAILAAGFSLRDK